MDNTRLFLYAALVFVGMLLWQQWQADYGPKPPVTEQSVINQGSSSNGSDANLPDMDDLPDQAETTVNTIGTDDIPGANSNDAVATSKRILVETDVIRAEIDTLGGVVRSLKLKKFPVSLEEPDNLLEIVHSDPDSVYLMQSGLRNKENTAPTHYSSFQASQSEYRLEDGSDELIVPLVWRENGIEVVKSYHFKRGDYLVDVKHRISNQSDQPWQGAEYHQNRLFRI